MMLNLVLTHEELRAVIAQAVKQKLGTQLNCAIISMDHGRSRMPLDGDLNIVVEPEEKPK